MKTIIEFSDLKQRADLIGVALCTLATDAGLSEANVYKWGQGLVASPRIATVEALERALIAREKEALRKARALVEHLTKLHPPRSRRNAEAHG